MKINRVTYKQAVPVALDNDTDYPIAVIRSYQNKPPTPYIIPGHLKDYRQLAVTIFNK